MRRHSLDLGERSEQARSGEASIYRCISRCYPTPFRPRAGTDRFAQMNSFGYIFTAWVPIFTFPANKQPYIVAGNYITAGFGGAAAAIVLIMAHLHNRDL